MKLPSFIVSKLQCLASKVAMSRPPDVVIGDQYLHRWWVIPRNRWFNIYLHHFLGSDDPAALHDHPWTNISCLIRGRYKEHTIAKGGTHYVKTFDEGELKARMGSYAHRVELFPGETTWTLFITGPKYRHWYFHCKKKLVHWADYVSNSAGQSRIGSGCGEYE
jgi:hypothetical protein